MEIVVVDDFSQDQNSVRDVVAMVGKGRVGFFAQSTNVGSLRNFETCISEAKGKLVHLLHADDYVHPGFYDKMASLFSAHPQIGAGFCHYLQVDENGAFLSEAQLQQEFPGILPDWLNRITQAQHIQVASMVVKREVYEHLGAFHSVIYGEDWEMWVRIAAHYPVGYLPETLASYRVHEASISGRTVRNGYNFRDLRKVINLNQQYLTGGNKIKNKRISCRYYADMGMATAADSLSKGDLKAARAQMLQAMLLYRDWRFFKKAMLKYIRTFQT